MEFFPQRSGDDLIRFQTIGLGSIRLARKYITRERLRNLCAVESMVIADEHGEELYALDTGDAFVQDLDPGRIYTVLDEESLDSEEEPQTAEEYYALQLKMQQKLLRRIQISSHFRRELIAELYKPKHPHLYKLTEVELHPKESLFTFFSPFLFFS
jgi:hypothetical protein